MRRRDYSEGVIDRANWLDIRQRTEDLISAARREYDRLTGSATMLGDISATERVCDAWESWTTDRKRAAHQGRLAPGHHQAAPARHGEQPRRQHQEPGDAPRTRDGHPAEAGGIRLAYLGRETSKRRRQLRERLRRSCAVMRLVSFHGGCFRLVARWRGCRARSRRVPRLLPGLRSAPAGLAVPGNAARRRRRPAIRPRGLWRSSRQRVAGHPRRVAASDHTLLLVADRDCPRPRPQRVCRLRGAGARETTRP
jgi:hypothetical protein